MSIIFRPWVINAKSAESAGISGALRFSERQENMQFRISQAHDDGSEDIVSRQDFGKTAKDIPIAFKVRNRK